MNKVFHPAIRNGKPVLVEKAEIEMPNGDDYIEKQPRGITTYLGELHKDNKAHQQHLANLGVLEVNPELLNAMPELWCKLWFSDVEFSFKEEGYTGQEALVEGVDFKTIPTAVFIKGHYSNTCVSCKKLFFYTAKRWLLCKSCCEKPIAVPIQAQQDLSGDLTYSLILLLSQACKQLEKHEIDLGLVEECKEFMEKYLALTKTKTK